MGHRVLLVEDRSDTLLALNEILTHEGHKVTLSASGEDASRRYDPTRFDVVVVDYMLPGMNGIEFVRRLREFDPRVGIILYTGRAEKEELEKEVEGYDVWSVLIKPIGRKELLKKIEEAADFSSTTEEAKTRMVKEMTRECEAIRSSRKNGDR